MRSDTGDLHSSQRRLGEALRRAEAAVLEALQNVLGAEVCYSHATPLFDGGLDLDSIGFLELILDIEKKLGVGLRSEDLNGDAITTVNGLVRHVVVVLSRDADAAERE